MIIADEIHGDLLRAGVKVHHLAQAGAPRSRDDVHRGEQDV